MKAAPAVPRSREETCGGCEDACAAAASPAGRGRHQLADRERVVEVLQPDAMRGAARQRRSMVASRCAPRSAGASGCSARRA